MNRKNVSIIIVVIVGIVGGIFWIAGIRSHKEEATGSLNGPQAVVEAKSILASLKTAPPLPTLQPENSVSIPALSESFRALSDEEIEKMIVEVQSEIDSNEFVRRANRHELSPHEMSVFDELLKKKGALYSVKVERL